MNNQEILQIAEDVISKEIQSLHELIYNLDENFSKCVEAILSTKGRVIISGIGKSGIIARKFSASLASTGTPSYFLHPAEAFHGDLGMVLRDDIFIAISNSGETDELLKLIPSLKNNGNFIISITGNVNSTLASHSNCKLNISVSEEACNLKLAPTSSTTATIALGDAITVALMKIRNFTPENFALLHPGGALGRKLLSNVKDEMVSLPKFILDSDDGFDKVVNCISSGHLGFSIVKGSDANKYSIITDGDLRRAIEKYSRDVFTKKASEIASTHPLSINSDARTEQAFEYMEQNKVNFLLVMEDNCLIGVIKK